MARSGPGSGSVRCLPVFPKVDAASPRGLSQPPGLSALGCQGSACDRLRLTGGLRAPPSGVMELYSTVEVLHRISKSAKVGP